MGNNNNLKVVAALVAGAVAGTALGILFAPARGSDTRKKALNKAKDIAENLKNKIRNEGVESNGKPEAAKELAGN